MSIGTGEYLFSGKGLGDVVDGSYLKSLYQSLNICVPGNEHQGNISCFRVSSKFLCRFKAADARHGDIKDDQVRLGFESNLNGKFPIGNQESIIAIGFQHPAQAFPYLFNIICDDDAILFVSDTHRV